MTNEECFGALGRMLAIGKSLSDARVARMRKSLAGLGEAPRAGETVEEAFERVCRLSDVELAALMASNGDLGKQPHE